MNPGLGLGAGIALSAALVVWLAWIWLLVHHSARSLWQAIGAGHARVLSRRDRQWLGQMHMKWDR